MSTVATAYSLRDADLLLTDEDHPYVLRVRDMDAQDKPREKMLAFGPGELSLTELVAVVWGVGTRKEDVLQMSKRIVREYGEQTLVHETNPTKLASALDIPLQKACQLVASMEFGRRFYERRLGKPVYVRTAAQAYQLLRDMGSCQKEQLRGLYLNSRFVVIRDEVISVGSLTANIVHPREVFQPAIESGAVAVVIAHNHPSGAAEPTDADRAVTHQLRAAGTILGIELLDHLVITDQSYISLIEEGR
jgi:DNA repair protein RadC